jgi:hypothetical protein
MPEVPGLNAGREIPGFKAETCLVTSKGTPPSKALELCKLQRVSISGSPEAVL